MKPLVKFSQDALVKMDHLYQFKEMLIPALSCHGVIMETSFGASQHIAHSAVGDFEALLRASVKPALANPHW